MGFQRRPWVLRCLLFVGWLTTACGGVGVVGEHDGPSDVKFMRSEIRGEGAIPTAGDADTGQPPADGVGEVVDQSAVVPFEIAGELPASADLAGDGSISVDSDGSTEDSTPSSCGDGGCQGWEDCVTCDGNEGCADCPLDCGDCPASCGDGNCGEDESCTLCPQDCGECLPSCGDGNCGEDESCTLCPQDCGECLPSCGNGMCEGSESCSTCPKDCGECPPACGNGKCDGNEGCSSCPQDCGECPPPTDPPGGRTNFVVALGKLHSGEKNNDWVRVGSYVFNPAKKTVDAAMWKWTQDNPTLRQPSGLTPNGTCSGGKNEVRACEILMLAGFKDAPNDNRQGTYKVQTDSGTGKPYVRIDWTPNWFEEWWLPTSGAQTYAVLEFKESDKATVAFAYGSNAPLTERRAYSSVIKEEGLVFEKWIRKRACADCNYAQVSKNKDETNHFTKWTVCGDGLTWVMTYWDPESSDACGGVADSSIQFYMFRPKSESRRDGWWFWHTCKTAGGAWNECYGCDNSDRHGGSHIYGLMQVLNDSGNYVGHIGVEAGFDEGTCSNPTQYRYSDVLGVVRLTPETGYLNKPAAMP